MDLDATSTCFFGVSDSEIQTSLLRLTDMETSWKIKISFEASSDMMLSNRRITKAQIGLRGSVPMLFKSRRQVFSHRDENMLTPFHGKFFCLDGLLIRRSKSKFLGTHNFFFLVLNLFYIIQRRSNIFITEKTILFQGFSGV